MNTKDKVAHEVPEKLSELPEHRLQEVLDFIEFLKTREHQREDPILDVTGCLSGTPLSAEEIEGYVYGDKKA